MNFGAGRSIVRSASPLSATLASLIFLAPLSATARRRRQKLNALARRVKGAIGWRYNPIQVVVEVVLHHLKVGVTGAPRPRAPCQFFRLPTPPRLEATKMFRDAAHGEA